MMDSYNGQMFGIVPDLPPQPISLSPLVNPEFLLPSVVYQIPQSPLQRRGLRFSHLQSINLGWLRVSGTYPFQGPTAAIPVLSPIWPHITSRPAPRRSLLGRPSAVLLLLPAVCPSEVRKNETQPPLLLDPSRAMPGSSVR